MKNNPFETDQSCPVCGSRWRNRIKTFPTYGRCSGCGLICSLGPAAAAEFYDASYFTVEDGTHGFRDFTSPESIAYDDARFYEELDELGTPGPNASVLDVGCATGEFLKRARNRGWATLGVEVSAEATALAEAAGLEVVADLDQAETRPSFDLITMHHVLEHIDDPQAILKRLALMLKPGGRLLIESPNWHSLERMSYGRKWVDLRPEQHVWHFAPNTLRQLFDSAGLLGTTIYTKGEAVASLGNVAASIGVPPAVFALAAKRHRKTPPNQAQSASTEQSAIASRIAVPVNYVMSRLKMGHRLVALYRRHHA